MTYFVEQHNLSPLFDPLSQIHPGRRPRDPLTDDTRLSFHTVRESFTAHIHGVNAIHEVECGGSCVNLTLGRPELVSLKEQESFSPWTDNSAMVLLPSFISHI